MLVLTRQIGERIQIGDDIVVEIREVRGNKVSVGIEAPPQVRILREELGGNMKGKPPEAA